ncbi:WD40/YVTN/BNR-like repeat-containing protein [Pseudomonas veronii]|uniref:WD40/YVTN/BNR-like repeat-containing protein n=1 Tax=Pseudomonas veronii TaxID=76761 RepID=UPI0021C1DC37|nr:YCF48-related protein [Pseudomonas veronii]MCT9823800.1 YCF48-related protein [Pseudomonas veronii]
MHTPYSLRLHQGVALLLFLLLTLLPPRHSYAAEQLAPQVSLVALTKAGSHWIGAGDLGTVVLSEDAKIWRAAESKPVQELLTAVAFTDAQRGWAVGHGGVVLYTEDGGTHWVLQARLEGSPVLLSVWAGTQGVAIITGAYGYAARTTNAGQTWEAFRPAEEGSDYHLNQIFGAPDGALFIAAESGVAYRSKDGGQHWTLLDTGVQGSLWTGLALADGRLLMAGMSGRVLLSEDGGDKWRVLDPGVEEAITALVQLPDGRVALAGNGGVLSVSDAALEHFTTTVRSDRQNLAALEPLEGGKVLVAGQQGIRVQDIPR